MAVVGPGVAPAFPGGSFFCRVHNRGFATQQFFFDHLALVDGVDPFLASENIFADGGVWVFTGE